MMWVGLMVLMTTSLLLAQEQEKPTCSCQPYFYCRNRTWDQNEKCPFYTHMCCELNQTAVALPTLSPVMPPQSPRADKKPWIPHVPQICGIRNKTSSNSDIIWKVYLPPGVKGDTNFGEFPWMTAIIRHTPENKTFLGGGSIIYPNIILTAAHKVKDIPASELLVKTGMWNKNDESEKPKHQDRTVLQVKLHPGFDQENWGANNFALLVLDQSLEITDNVAPVCLPSSSMPFSKSSCIAAGWGVGINGESKRGILKMVNLPVIDYDICQIKMRSFLGSTFQLHNSFICAGGVSQGDTSTGDGGGPLMCPTIDNPNQFVQVGITSWGVNSSGDAPGAYSSVEKAVDWIETQAKIYDNSGYNLKSDHDMTEEPTTPLLEATEQTSIPNPPQTLESVACGIRNNLHISWKSNLYPPGDVRETTFGEFPWMTAIIQTTREGQRFVCGGSIIYPNLILTVAHTIKDIPASELLVKTGVWNSTDMSEIHQVITVQNIVLHPRFKKGNVAYDVALLVLDQSLKITKYVAPVCLPSTSMPIDDYPCIATGWGADKYGKSNAGVLKKVVLPLTNYKSASQPHGYGYQGNTCDGYVGGPVICPTMDNSDQFVQVGIVTFGFGCSHSVSGAYYNVTAAANWIQSITDMFLAN